MAMTFRARCRRLSPPRLSRWRGPVPCSACCSRDPVRQRVSRPPDRPVPWAVRSAPERGDVAAALAAPVGGGPESGAPGPLLHAVAVPGPGRGHRSPRPGTRRGCSPSTPGTGPGGSGDRGRWEHGVGPRHRAGLCGHRRPRGRPRCRAPRRLRCGCARGGAGRDRAPRRRSWGTTPAGVSVVAPGGGSPCGLRRPRWGPPARDARGRLGGGRAVSAPGWAVDVPAARTGGGGGTHRAVAAFPRRGPGEAAVLPGGGLSRARSPRRWRGLVAAMVDPILATLGGLSNGSFVGAVALPVRCGFLEALRNRSWPGSAVPRPPGPGRARTGAWPRAG